MIQMIMSLIGNGVVEDHGLVVIDCEKYHKTQYLLAQGSVISPALLVGNR